MDDTYKIPTLPSRGYKLHVSGASHGDAPGRKKDSALTQAFCSYLREPPRLNFLGMVATPLSVLLSALKKYQFLQRTR